jgi:hypothetical protein
MRRQPCLIRNWPVHCCFQQVIYIEIQSHFSLLTWPDRLTELWGRGWKGFDLLHISLSLTRLSA